MSQTIASVAARQLGLDPYEEEEPRSTQLGIPVINLKSKNEAFEVLLAEEVEEPESLHKAAVLAGFYNSRFFHEFAALNKSTVPVGYPRGVFRIEDSHAHFSLLALTRHDGLAAAELSLAHLQQVAEQLARLHAIGTYDEHREFCCTVMENYQVVSEYRRESIQEAVQQFGQICASPLFAEPEKVLKELNELYISFRDSPPEEAPQVLCHGQLTADNLRFDADGRLVSIVDWENVHFGDPAYDLTTLIISSASASVRRDHFMKVFRTYFYTLIDIRAQKFKLSDLKQAFRRHHLDAVLQGLPILIEQICSSTVSEADKQRSAHRWAGALHDAYAFHSGDFISDDEQCFFAK